MSPRRRASIRLWQTALFIIVIVVAMLILSGSLSAGLRDTLSEKAEAAELRNAAALARRLEPEFPVTVESMERVRGVLAEYRGIYGGGIWVYDRDGTLLESAAEDGPSDDSLERARIGGLAENPPYASTDLRANGWVVAARSLKGPGGSREGVVVTASSVADSLEVLSDVRSRLWVTFWVSLLAAGLLGFGFSQLMSRRIKAMSVAAAAIAGGDFEQRLPTGFVPDEVHDLALSYNSMAVKLGEAFGAIQESQRQIEAVVDSMAEGVIAFDSDGVIRVINPEAVRLLEESGEPHDASCREHGGTASSAGAAAGAANGSGASGGGEQELLGCRAEDIITEPGLIEVIHAGLAGESSVKTAPLGKFMVLMHATPLLDATGSVEGAVLLMADVTEQYRIEDAQRRFVADASHEMRTPIAALKGMLELLEDGAKEVPEVRDDFIHTMQVEADRLSRLVNDLLTLARLEAGTLELKITAEYVASLLGDVASIMHTLAEDAGVTLAVDLPDGDQRVLGDRDRIVQVLLSFTDNALKHSPSGSTIHLRASLRGQRVLLEVADEGEGIEAEQLERVFERFFRADAARAGGGGAGLGLAIAKEIVEAHDADIEVSSAPGEGTTFGFMLPLASNTSGREAES